MTVLTISREGREIVKARVGSTMILIGRSPACDVVLRAQGVQPVHFLMEWIGEGELESGNGMWSVFDVSSTGGNEADTGMSGVGEGVVVGEKPVLFCGFEFRWIFDRLMEAPLTGGALLESFDQKKFETNAQAKEYQLELVTIRQDSGSVSHVYHVDMPEKRKKRRIVFPHVKELKVEWGGVRKVDSNSPVHIDIRLLGGAKVLKKGVEVKAENGFAPSDSVLLPGDLLQVRWRLNDHYFRLVPRIMVPPVKHSLREDPFYRFALFGLLLAFVFFIVIHQINLVTPEVPPPEPPRVAKVEVPAPEPQQVQMPAEKPVEEAAVKAPAEQHNDAAAPAKSAKPNPQAKPAPGLNTPANKGDVNTVGLLGALKAKKTATVRADRVLNQGLVSKTVQGTQGNFAVQQPVSGAVDNKNSAHGDLTGAYTTLNVKDAATEESTGLIGAPGGHGKGTAYSETDADKQAGDDEVAAEGGLDKESVKRAIALYRKDIRTCYEHALLTKPKIKGRVVYKWQITPNGPVQWIEQQSSTLDSPTLALCVKTVLKGVMFPKAPNHRPTIVIYPFEFQSKN